MNENRIRVRVCKSTGEIEVEGAVSEVSKWWEKLWPEISEAAQSFSDSREPRPVSHKGTSDSIPEIFGEYFTEFRSDLTDVDRILVAAQYAVGKDPEKVFTTKIANQLLLTQNIKIGNPSECVRRLIISKKIFVVTGGKFRVSSVGIEYLASLKSISTE